MYIYSVVKWNPVHADCCQSTWKNKGMEKYRTRVKGVFLNKEKAEEHAKSFGEKYWVEKHKILDWNGLNNSGLGI